MVYEAAKMHIPTMIHESNSVVGVANKFLGHYVDKICYTFDDAANQFSEKKKNWLKRVTHAHSRFLVYMKKK